VSNNAGIETRDAQSGALLSSWTLPKPFTYVAEISSDGSRVLGVRWDGKKFESSRAQVFETASGKPLQVLEDDQTNLSSARFSRDGLKLMAPVPGGSLAIFDIASGKRDRLLTTDYSNSLSGADITPDGKYLLSAQEVSSDLERWDLTALPSNPFAPHTLGEASNGRPIHIAPDGSLWSGSESIIWRGDYSKGQTLKLSHMAADGKVIQEISIPDTHLLDTVTFSPDCSTVVASLSTKTRDLREGAGVSVWDIQGKKLLWHLPGDKSMMRQMAFSPDNKTLFTGSDNALVQQWDMATGQEIRTLFHAQSSIKSLLLSADSKYLAVGTEGGTALIFDVASGQKTAELANDGSLLDLAFSPDGKLLAAGGTLKVEDTVVGASISVWDIAQHKVVAEFSAPERLFTGLAFSPDGKRLVAAHVKEYGRKADGRMDVWDIASKRLITTLRDRSGTEHPAFSPDGKTLLSIDGQWIKAWDLSSIDTALKVADLEARLSAPRVTLTLSWWGHGVASYITQMPVAPGAVSAPAVGRAVVSGDAFQSLPAPPKSSPIGTK